MALLGVALVVLERFSIAIDPWLGQWALIVVGLCGMAPIAFGPLLHSHVPASYFISATAISSGAMACAWATMLTAAIVNAIALNSLDPTRWVTALAVGVVTGLIVAVATWVVSMRNAERCVRAWFQVARTSAAAVPWSKVAGIATVQDPKSRNAVLDQIGRPFTGKPLGSTAELSISRSAQISPATGATVADADGDAGGPRANKGTISTDAINLLRVRDEPPRRQVFESPHQVEFGIFFSSIRLNNRNGDCSYKPLEAYA
ncbi:hypothetical protein BC828DRAFT_77909 [Blastocladiella britannica]|nr:hypothetical protein BC828DRAFT_77909 [Blastocladiella britannica]